jgi:hypothetical protein
VKFEKGKSGNPGGRPKIELEVIRAAQDVSVEAVNRLAHWMRCDDPKASIPAAEKLLNRAFGTPAQTVAVEQKGDLGIDSRAALLALVAALGAEGGDTGGSPPNPGRDGPDLGVLSHRGTA